MCGQPARYTTPMVAFTVVLSPDPEQPAWVAICPAMPGTVTEGDTREEALKAMSLVMSAWIDLAAEDGYGPVPETPALVAEEVAAVLRDREEAGWDRTIETTMLEPAEAIPA